MKKHEKGNYPSLIMPVSWLYSASEWQETMLMNKAEVFIQPRTINKKNLWVLVKIISSIAWPLVRTANWLSSD